MSPSLIPKKKFSALGLRQSLDYTPKQQKMVPLPAGREALLGSLSEGGKFMEGVPEERGLPLGLRQGKDLLLGDTGGHGDMALVHGVQALGQRSCWAAAVAF